jgi:Immunoglobulin-like domain of bacterial spore germination
MIRLSTRIGLRFSMKQARLFLISGILVFAALGCNLPMMAAIADTPTSSIPTFEPSSPFAISTTNPAPLETEIGQIQSPIISPTTGSTPPPAQGNAPKASPTTNPIDHSNEAILILEPGPGSRVTSPLHVAGEANSVFEQTLGIRIVQDDGTVLAIGPVFIESELGQRGPFSVDVPFEVTGERQAAVQVFESSPRDGGITHLASVGLILANSGEEQVSQSEPGAERIQITKPEISSKISGSTAHVEGYAVASFEQNLVVEVQDAEGNIVGSMPVSVQSQEMGVPGPFSVDVPYEVSSAGPGRIVVRDPSPAFEVDLHLASVEVDLEP